MSYIKRWIEENMYETLESISKTPASNKKFHYPLFLCLLWLGLGILTILNAMYLVYGNYSTFQILTFIAIVFISILIAKVLISYTNRL